MKNVLLISDDFNSDEFETLKYLIRSQNSEKNSIKFKFYLTKDFEKIPKIKFDIALVDYGLIGNYKNPHETSIKILEGLHSKGIILIWCGGLAGYSNDDTRALFPSKYFMHNLNFCGVGYHSIIEILYIELKKLKEKK